MTRKSKRTRRSKPKQDGPYFLEHPFSDLDPKQLKKALAELGDQQEIAFSEHLEILDDLLRSKYPLQMLSTLSAYGLQTGVSKDGVGQSGFAGPEFSQHNVEIISALLMRIPPSGWGQEPALPEDVQLAYDSLRNLAASFNQKRLSKIQQDVSEEAAATIRIQEWLRVHTQVVRNWGYFSKVVEISAEIYGAIDDISNRSNQFTAKDSIHLFRTLLTRIERLSNNRFRSLTKVFREKKPQRMVRRYYKENPQFADNAEEFIEQLNVHSLDREQVASMILSHADLSLPNIFSFSTNEIASECGISPEVVERILVHFSLSPGDLAANDPEHFFLSNPIWTKPVVRLSESEFFCLLPQGFFSHIHSNMESLVPTEEGKRRLETAKSRYLEDKATRLLSDCLPNCSILENVTWNDGGQVFETDRALFLDSILILVEAKSGSVSQPALRGAPDRARRHVEDLILHPSLQSARLEEKIRRALSGSQTDQTELAEFGERLLDVTEIARVSITIDDFAAILSNENEFKTAGWIPTDHGLAPCIAIADLECVLDILSQPPIIVHYLIERSRQQRAITAHGDELDWLGLYLDTLFNFHGLEESNPVMVIVGMSQIVDDYYTAVDAGLNPTKPTPQLSNLWRDLISSLELRSKLGWLTISLAILRSASPDEQRRIEKEIDRIAKSVRKNWRNPNHLCSVSITPPHSRSPAVIFHLFPDQLQDKRYETAEVLASQQFSSSEVSRCVVVAINIDRQELPYAFVGIYDRPTEGPRSPI